MRVVGIAQSVALDPVTVSTVSAIAHLIRSGGMLTPIQRIDLVAPVVGYCAFRSILMVAPFYRFTAAAPVIAAVAVKAAVPALGLAEGRVGHCLWRPSGLPTDHATCASSTLFGTVLLRPNVVAVVPHRLAHVGAVQILVGPRTVPPVEGLIRRAEHVGVERQAVRVGGTVHLPREDRVPEQVD